MKRTVTLSTGREVTVDDAPVRTGAATVHLLIHADFVPTDEEREEMRRLTATTDRYPASGFDITQEEHAAVDAEMKRRHGDLDGTFWVTDESQVYGVTLPLPPNQRSPRKL